MGSMVSLWAHVFAQSWEYEFWNKQQTLPSHYNNLEFERRYIYIFSFYNNFKFSHRIILGFGQTIYDR